MRHTVEDHCIVRRRSREYLDDFDVADRSQYMGIQEIRVRSSLTLLSVRGPVDQTDLI